MVRDVHREFRMFVANQTVHDVIGAAIAVHRSIGPGLFESAYEESIAHEFALRKIMFRRQASVPLKYKDVTMGLRLPNRFHCR